MPSTRRVPRPATYFLTFNTNQGYALGSINAVHAFGTAALSICHEHWFCPCDTILILIIRYLTTLLQPRYLLMVGALVVRSWSTFLAGPCQFSEKDRVPFILHAATWPPLRPQAHPAVNGPLLRRWAVEKAPGEHPLNNISHICYPQYLLLFLGWLRARRWRRARRFDESLTNGFGACGTFSSSNVGPPISCSSRRTPETSLTPGLATRANPDPGSPDRICTRPDHPPAHQKYHRNQMST